MIRILERDHVLYKLLSDTYDYLYVSKGNFSNLCNAITVAWLNEEKPAYNMELIRELTAERKYLLFDNGYLTATNEEAFRDEGQKIQLEVRDGMATYLSSVIGELSAGGAMMLADYGKVNPFFGRFDPLEYLIVVPKRDTKAFGTTLEQGIPYILPALSVYWLFKMDTKAAMETSGELVLNTGLCAIGMEGLAGAGSADVGRELLNLSLVDFITYVNAAPEMLQDHPQVVKYANYLALAYMVGTLTTGSVKAIRNARIAVPVEMIGWERAEMTTLIGKLAVGLEERKVLQLKEILGRMEGELEYIIPFKVGDKYGMLRNSGDIIYDFYSLIRGKDGVELLVGKEIVVISEGDLSMVKRLSKLADRELIVNNGCVRIYDNGVIEAEYGFLRVKPDGSAEEVAFGIGKNMEPGTLSIKFGEIMDLDEWTQNIINNLKIRIAKLPKADHVFNFNENDIQLVVKKGREIGITDEEIEDIIYNGCRVGKNNSAKDLIGQMEYYIKVKKYGYPKVFTNDKEFKEFRDLVKGLIKDWDLPEGNVYFQGSALMKDNINDLDVAIIVGLKEYEALCNRFKVYLTNPDLVESLGTTGRIPGSLIRQSAEKNARSLASQFHDRFIAKFGKDFPEKYKINVHISIIQVDGRLDVSPYLKLE